MSKKQNERTRRYFLNLLGARKAKATGRYYIWSKPFKLRMEMPSYAELNKRKRLGLIDKREYKDVLRFPMDHGYNEGGGATNMRFVKADDNYDCNACLFIKDCLSDVTPDLTFTEKRAVIRARKNNWEVKKGEMCRRYTWEKGTEEEMDIVEIPEMAEICNRLDLYQ